VADESKADGGSIRSAIRWGLVLAAVATIGFRLPRLAQESRAWREAARLSDSSEAAKWGTFFVADSVGLLIVSTFGVVIYFVLRPRGKSQP
jgi:hypothetical protein